MAFDLDKLIAERPKSASRKKKFSFVFEGKTYAMPNEVDAIALNAAVKGDVITAFQRVLTPEQYQEIVASTVVLEYGAVLELMTAYYDHITGLRAGESSASPGSSKSTVKPLKRTSKGSTRRAVSKTSARRR